MFWFGGCRFAAKVMRRVRFFQKPAAVFAESKPHSLTASPGHIGRAAGFEMKFIARVRAQCSEKKLVLTEISGQNRLQARRLPRTPDIKAPAFPLINITRVFPIATMRPSRLAFK